MVTETMHAPTVLNFSANSCWVTTQIVAIQPKGVRCKSIDKEKGWNHQPCWVDIPCSQWWFMWDEIDMRHCPSRQAVILKRFPIQLKRRIYVTTTPDANVPKKWNSRDRGNEVARESKQGLRAEISESAVQPSSSSPIRNLTFDMTDSEVSQSFATNVCGPFIPPLTWNGHHKSSRKFVMNCHLLIYYNIWRRYGYSAATAYPSTLYDSLNVRMASEGIPYIVLGFTVHLRKKLPDSWHEPRKPGLSVKNLGDPNSLNQLKCTVNVRTQDRTVHRQRAVRPS